MSNLVFGNDYKTQLDELNTYLKTFDNNSSFFISVRDNIFYIDFDDYETANTKISNLLDAEIDYVKKKVYLRCNSNNCLHYLLTDEYVSYFTFSNSTTKNLETLADLINKFLAAYRGETVKTDDSSGDYLDYFLYDMFVGEKDKESKPATNHQSTNSTTVNNNRSSAALARKPADSKVYTDELNQLNQYMKTFDNGYYGSFKLEDGYLIETFKSGDYCKAKMTSIEKAVEETPKTKVIIKCKKGETCVYSTFTNSQHSQMSLSQSNDFKTSELINLINNFIAAYNSK